MATTTMTLPVSMGAGPFAIATAGVTKRYGRVQALDGVELQVPEGAVYALVGPNGAGKSTLLRVLLGLTTPDSGSLSVPGGDPRVDGARVRAHAGYVPEDQRPGYAWMTVGRLFRHHEAYYPSWDAVYARTLADAYGIDPTRKCRALSKGERRRVQLLLALAHRPPILLLDEPTDGLDHVARDQTLGILSEHLADRSTTVIVSTHRVHEVESLVDHVGVLSGGRLIGQLPCSTLRAKMLRYWADVPDGWSGSPRLEGTVIRRGGRGREIEWTVWGDRDAVLRDLSSTGAAVREITPLSVDDAALALLSRPEAS